MEEVDGKARKEKNIGMNAAKKTYISALVSSCSRSQHAHICEFCVQVKCESSFEFDLNKGMLVVATMSSLRSFLPMMPT